MFKMSGHRLGLMIATPLLIVGTASGLHRSYLRHVGLLPNGLPPLYPGYTEDGTPYIVKHKVSDRHADLPHKYDPQPVLMLEGAAKDAFVAAAAMK